jgi:siderophore synthetase component
LVHNDPYLRAHGFRLIREVAFMAFRHRHYEQVVSERSSTYKEMLGAIFRENPAHHVGPGQRLMTMAALMYVDRDGAALLPALIEASGLGVSEWLRRYLRCYLKPLLHCFYQHHLTFSPHCENVILVLEHHIPVRLIIKDLAEDIGVLNPDYELPEKVRGLALKVPEDVMTLAIFTDAFDCVFRFLAQVLLEHANFSDEAFWSVVAASIHEYQAEHPHLADKFRRYDLFAPAFLRNCLNRLQLTNNRMMVDLNAPEPVDSLQFVGTLHNPITHLKARRGVPVRAGEAHDAL